MENKKKKHRFRMSKCECCNGNIDVETAVENKDFDYFDKTKTKIIVYCEKCGNENIIKL